MILGPWHPLLLGSTKGFDPVKPLKVSSNKGASAILFGDSYPYSMNSEVQATDVEMAVLLNTQANLLAAIHQVEELCKNTEWHRCGIYIQWREDGTIDSEDGWYNIVSVEVSEDLIFSAYAEPKIEVELRAWAGEELGVYVDQKAVANDWNYGGIPMAAFPQGIGNTFPAATWTMIGSDGSTIGIVENPPTVIRGPLVSGVNACTLGRCSVSDGAVEVFHPQHRFIDPSGLVTIQNGLVKYVVNVATAGSPVISVWNRVSAWVIGGNYQIQCYDGTTYTPLLVQALKVLTCSPEEVIWEERRYDANGLGFARVVNRMRRGSIIIESQIVAASGLGLNGAQCIGLVSATTVTYSQYSVNQTAFAAVQTGAATPVIAGFVYINQPQLGPGAASPLLYSGLGIPSGSVGRIGIACGHNADPFYTADCVAPSAPGAPTVTPIGTGTTHYSYIVDQVSPAGTPIAGATGSTTTGAATLNMSTQIQIEYLFTPTTGCTWSVYRSVGGAYGVGLIGTGLTGLLNFFDTGLPVLGPQYTIVSETTAQYAQYLQRWAAYNRTRVKQRFVVS